MDTVTTTQRTIRPSRFRIVLSDLYLDACPPPTLSPDLHSQAPDGTYTFGVRRRRLILPIGSFSLSPAPINAIDRVPADTQTRDQVHTVLLVLTGASRDDSKQVDAVRCDADRRQHAQWAGGERRLGSSRSPLTCIVYGKHEARMGEGLARPCARAADAVGAGAEVVDEWMDTRRMLLSVGSGCLHGGAMRPQKLIGSASPLYGRRGN
ncbi:hypothetical protein B0H14DRAFT_2606473 [Mycena olivaceomarginata]|nr:hypothetical protein B0H14DRAFT_2606473 [Mycena olivaceomarginata]